MVPSVALGAAAGVLRTDQAEERRTGRQEERESGRRSELEAEEHRILHAGEVADGRSRSGIRTEEEVRVRKAAAGTAAAGSDPGEDLGEGPGCSLPEGEDSSLGSEGDIGRVEEEHLLEKQVSAGDVDDVEVEVEVAAYARRGAGRSRCMPC